MGSIGWQAPEVIADRVNLEGDGMISPAEGCVDERSDEGDISPVDLRMILCLASDVACPLVVIPSFQVGDLAISIRCFSFFSSLKHAAITVNSHPTVAATANSDRLLRQVLEEDIALHSRSRLAVPRRWMFSLWVASFTIASCRGRILSATGTRGKQTSSRTSLGEKV